MHLKDISKLRLYAVHLREMTAREEHLGTERSKLPSWKEARQLLIRWAEELDREASEAERASEQSQRKNHC
jgi:hypothetical protein